MANPQNSKTERFKIMGLNAVFALLIFLLVTLNKSLVRPAIGDSEILRIISGSFPNFIAALLLSMCAVNGVLVKMPSKSRIIVYLFSVAVALVLIFEEFYSMWGASSQYDLYDIYASVIGSILAILTFEHFYFWRNKKHKK